MGGRGGSSGKGGGGGGGGGAKGETSKTTSGPIGEAPPVQVTNEKSRSSGNQWRYTVVEATHEGNGVISLGSPSKTKYESVNRNTTEAMSTLKAGIYNQPGDRSLKTHNINWDKVKQVKGQTFDVKGLLKEKGFSFDGTTKTWIKK